MYVLQGVKYKSLIPIGFVRSLIFRIFLFLQGYSLPLYSIVPKGTQHYIIVNQFYKQERFHISGMVVCL